MKHHVRRHQTTERHPVECTPAGFHYILRLDERLDLVHQDFREGDATVARIEVEDAPPAPLFDFVARHTDSDHDGVVEMPAFNGGAGEPSITIEDVQYRIRLRLRISRRP